MRCAPLALLLTILAATACSSQPVRERGWVGGELILVSAQDTWFEVTEPPALRPNRVVGLPVNVGMGAGLLVADPGDGTPLAAAGLERGDLLLRRDGAPVGDALEFREDMEGRATGDTVQLELFRDGRVLETVVTVGKESYRSYGFVRIGLGLSSTIDIWPFDDGINLLNLVVIAWDDHRHELGGAAGTYLRRTFPDAEVALPSQETFTFRVVPLGVGRMHRVLTQTPAPAEPAE